MTEHNLPSPVQAESYTPANYELTPELRKLFEVDSIENGEPAETLAGYSYIIGRMQILEGWGDELDEETARATAVSFALNRFKEVSHTLKTRWGDIFEDRNARALALSQFVPERLKMLKKAEASDDAFSSLTSPEALRANLTSLSVTLSMGNRRTFEAANQMYSDNITPYVSEVIYEEIDDPIAAKFKRYVDLIDHSHRTIYRAGMLNPSRTKRDLKRLYEKIDSGKFDNLMQASHAEEELSVDTIDFFKQHSAQELSFTVLSPDTNLGEIAENIYHESSDSEKTYVDPKRVALLADIRELVGKERCYFARGKITGKTHLDINGQRINEDYIVLVMQHHDEFGEVIGEDALAISPIARKHAAYLARHDTSHGLTWRELFQLTKSDAQELGTRRLKFTTVQGEDIVDTMQEKIFSLLTCDPKDFSGDLRRSMNGYKLVQRRALGNAALSEPYENFSN